MHLESRKFQLQSSFTCFLTVWKHVVGQEGGMQSEQNTSAVVFHMANIVLYRYIKELSFFHQN